MDWININDKTPNMYQEVIIASSEGRVKAAIYLGNGKWNTFLQITHWMPMPKAPSVEKAVIEENKKKRGRPKKGA